MEAGKVGVSVLPELLSGALQEDKQGDLASSTDLSLQLGGLRARVAATQLVALTLASACSAGFSQLRIDISLFLRPHCWLPVGREWPLACNLPVEVVFLGLVLKKESKV